MQAGLGRDIKDLTKAVYALDSTALTAGGGGDNTAVPGAAIDKMLYQAESVAFEIPCKAVLTINKTLVVKLTIEHSANNSDWTTVVAQATALTLAAAAGGSFYGVAVAGVDLNKCLRYVRVNALPDLNNTGTDTAVIGAGVAIFGGCQELP
jgi:3D (Asp-Asp-Asp) domain-containing protein